MVTDFRKQSNFISLTQNYTFIELPLPFVQVTEPGAMVINRAPVTQNWMVPAVLTCLCCFWPTGIFAIIAASNVNITVFILFVHLVTHIQNKKSYFLAILHPDFPLFLNWSLKVMAPYNLFVKKLLELADKTVLNV